MNIKRRTETYSGSNCQGYQTYKEAEYIKKQVEASTRNMPGLIELNVTIKKEGTKGRFFVHDRSLYDDDKCI